MKHMVGGRIEKGEFRLNSTLWLATSNHPFTAVQDKYLRKMMINLNPNTEEVFFSAVTASRDIIQVCKMSLPAVRDFLQVSLRTISLYVSAF
jgi:hypothetical protein